MQITNYYHRSFLWTLIDFTVNEHKDICMHSGTKSSDWSATEDSLPFALSIVSKYKSSAMLISSIAKNLNDYNFMKSTFKLLTFQDVYV